MGRALCWNPAQPGGLANPHPGLLQQARPLLDFVCALPLSGMPPPPSLWEPALHH